MSIDRVRITAYTWTLTATAYAIAVAHVVAMPRHREPSMDRHVVHMARLGRGREKTNRKTIRAVNITVSFLVV
jgi:hypothetical protein